MKNKIENKIDWSAVIDTFMSWYMMEYDILREISEREMKNDRDTLISVLSIGLFYTAD